MVCFGTAHNSKHNTCDCPILKNLGFKLEKRTPADNQKQDAASRVVCLDATTPAQDSAHASVPNPAVASDSQLGLVLAPGAFTAATEQESYNSGDKFEYKGKSVGVMYSSGAKTNNTSA